MRRLSLCLDSLPALREIAGTQFDLSAATSLAELAGVESLRLGIDEDLRPVAEADVQGLRRTAQLFELRMPASTVLLKVALETRPDVVVLAGDTFEGTLASRPVDLRSQSSGLTPIVRTLEEAGIDVAMLVTPALDSVKAAHGLGVQTIELFTGATVDLPGAERQGRLEGLADAARLAAKLRMTVGIGGGLDYRSVSEVLSVAPAVARVSVGRALLARALLVGMDRAARDFLALIR
ncbi:MAG: pyridoxine 5'-phosphate synthase [Myxococcota bacterium]|nr:pyridoxine 5'-phosphate synthase [Myxococcota bacterium]